MTRLTSLSAAARNAALTASTFSLDNKSALASLKKAIRGGRLDEAAFRADVKPYGALLSRPGTYRDTVLGLLQGTTDQSVIFAPSVKSQLQALLRPPSEASALKAFEKAVSNGTLSAAEVKSALEPYALVLRQPGRYRDTVSALVEGRADRSVKLSPKAAQFFKTEGLRPRA